MDKETAMECNDQSNRNSMVWIRAMLPMCILCNSCGHCIKKNTIFKSVGREIVTGESYLGIRVARFYFKCSKCSGEIIIKTDPKNEGYVIESGATENQKVSQAPTGNPTDALRCQFSSQLEL